MARNLGKIASSAGSLENVAKKFKNAAGNGSVSVTRWAATVDDNGLTMTCTVTAKIADAPITGAGLVVFSGTGAKQYGTQYTANTNSGSVLPSLTVNGVKLKAGSTVMAVVFGYVGNEEFYIEKEMAA